MATTDMSLEELMSQFQKVQQMEVEQKVNERNVVEIIQKLVQTKKMEIIFTVDGREYITPQHLRREVSDEIDAHSGRINVVDLPGLLNVDMSHTERAASEVVAERDDLRLLNGEYISEAYIDSVVEEVDQILQESQTLSVADVARRFKLSTQFMMEALAQRLGTAVHGFLEDETLYTESLLRRHEAIVRGAFAAISRPTPLVEVARRHQLRDTLFFRTVDSMLESGKLKGRMQGGSRGTYVPEGFERARTDMVHNFYVQNGYVAYAFLSKCGISLPQSYMTGRYNPPTRVDETKTKAPPKKAGRKAKPVPKRAAKAKEEADEPPVDVSEYPHHGAALSTCFVCHTLISNLHPHLEQLAGGGEGDAAPLCLDITGLLPSQFAVDDAESILQRCCDELPTVMRQCKVYSSFLISNAVFPKVIEQMSEYVKATLRAQYAAGTLKGLNKKKTVSKDEEEEDNTKKKGKQRKKGGAAAKEEDAPATVDMKKVRSLLLSHLPELESCEDVLDTMCEELETPVEAVYSSAKQEIAMDESTRVRGKRVEYERRINELWQEIQVYQKGIVSFEGVSNDATGAQLLHRHLLSTHCSTLVHLVALDNALELQEEFEEDTPTREIFPVFSRETRTALVALYDTLSLKSTSSFLHEMDRVTSQLNVYLKPMDKKKDRQHSQQRREDMVQRITSEDPRQDPAGLYLRLCILTYADRHHNFLHAPGKFVSHLVEMLTPMAEEKESNQRAYALLTELQGLVMDYLIFTKQDEEGVFPGMDDLSGKLDDLRELLMTTSMSPLLSSPLVPPTKQASLE